MTMDRRHLILSGVAAAVATPALGQDVGYEVGEAMPAPASPNFQPNGSFSRDEITSAVSDFFGVTAEAAAGALEKAFKDKGAPTGYVAGEEGSLAVALGLRYGKGLLYMKGRDATTVYWQGPSLGWDFGGNLSRVFTLCYNLEDPRDVYRRFPGVEGSAYVIGGLGVNYQKADSITLAPIRSGVGLRLGANVGYLAYSRKRNWIPV